MHVSHYGPAALERCTSPLLTWTHWMGWFNRMLQGEKEQIWQQIGIYLFFSSLSTSYWLPSLAFQCFDIDTKKSLFLILPDSLCSGWFIILHYAAGIFFFFLNHNKATFIYTVVVQTISRFFCATFGLNSRDSFKSDYIHGGGGTFARSRDFMAPNKRSQSVSTNQKLNRIQKTRFEAQ